MTYFNLKLNMVIYGVICSFLLSNFGCAAVMAAKQPDYKNISIVQKGISRDQIISEFGAPIISKEDINGNLVEHYQFKQGYKKSTKILRIVFHVTADVFTLFLWELIGMPIETGFDGNQTTVKTIYNKNEQLIKYNIIKK